MGISDTVYNFYYSQTNNFITTSIIFLTVAIILLFAVNLVYIPLIFSIHR